MSHEMAEDRLAKLEKLLPKLAQARAHADRGTAIHEAMDALKVHEAQIQSLTQLAAIVPFIARSWRHEDRADVVHAISQLRVLAKRIEAAATVTELNQIRAEAQHGVKGHLGTIDRVFRTAWAAMISERFLSLQPIADMLYEIESTAKHGHTLRELVKDAQQLAKKYPPTTDDRKKLTELEAKRTQHLQRLADLNVGQEVEAFLVAVAHSNATLEHVTSDVLTWIDENDARALFRISARRS